MVHVPTTRFSAFLKRRHSEKGGPVPGPRWSALKSPLSGPLSPVMDDVRCVYPVGIEATWKGGSIERGVWGEGKEGGEPMLSGRPSGRGSLESISPAGMQSARLALGGPPRDRPVWGPAALHSELRASYAVETLPAGLEPAAPARRPGMGVYVMVSISPLCHGSKIRGRSPSPGRVGASAPRIYASDPGVRARPGARPSAPRSLGRC
jgi:hypothetical protein